MTGKKFDAGKLQWSLVPWDGLKGAVRVLEMGAKKYSRDNWKEVPDAKIRYIDAMLRHITAMQDGDGIDPESGLPHIDHVVCNAMFVAYFESKLPRKLPKDRTYLECTNCLQNHHCVTQLTSGVIGCDDKRQPVVFVKDETAEEAHDEKIRIINCSSCTENGICSHQATTGAIGCPDGKTKGAQQ